MTLVVDGLLRADSPAVRVIDFVVWATFAADYAVRIHLAQNRWAFVRSHPLDLAAVALPALRVLRLLASLRPAFVDQVVEAVGGRAGGRGRGHPAAGSSIHGSALAAGPADLRRAELMRLEQPIAYRDGSVNAWLGAQAAAGQVAGLVHEQVDLGLLYDRIDAAEVECWGQFVARMRELAGKGR